jgi:hypothetical protein
MADHEVHAPVAPAVLADSGLRCPRCEYNLTGLTDARCPECGTTFDWEAVRRAAQNAPIIAFERARGWRQLPAFFVTWATILFAPWAFARQAVIRARGWYALVFGVLCFVPVTARYVLEWRDGEIWLVWIGTAAAYVLLQAVFLAAVDWSGWRHPLASLRFWLIMGGYTSAIVATEFVYGPVMVSETDLRRCAVDLLAGRLAWSEISELLPKANYPYGLDWVIIGIGLAGLACVYAWRLRRTGTRRTAVCVAAALIAVALFVLYAFCVEWIGAYILFPVVDRLLR